MENKITVLFVSYHSDDIIEKSIMTIDKNIKIIVVENSQNNVGTTGLNEFQDWRNVFFEKMDCKGVVINAGEGDVVVQGEVKSKTSDPTIMFWAPNPPTWSQSYSGSGLPYHDSIQAYQQSPNVGAVKAVNRNVRSSPRKINLLLTIFICFSIFTSKIFSSL